jgi:hypothetical protein
MEESTGSYFLPMPVKLDDEFEAIGGWRNEEGKLLVFGRFFGRYGAGAVQRVTSDEWEEIKRLSNVSGRVQLKQLTV